MIYVKTKADLELGVAISLDHTSKDFAFHPEQGPARAHSWQMRLRAAVDKFAAENTKRKGSDAVSLHKELPAWHSK
jgi:hypothetical protein